jgi:two-component system chemotaxis response regulator CheB
MASMATSNFSRTEIMADKIRVLIVDDSALVRQMLSGLLAEAPDIEVVGVAGDPFIARDKIKQLNPDVITLDVEMPRMDGITFLRNLMRLRPMPVVMVSTLTDRGADVTLQAIELGAFDYVTKPKLDFSHEIESYAQDIIAKVRAASRARVRPYEKPAGESKTRLQRSPSSQPFSTTDKIIAIGASTGGTEAIREVLEQLPPDVPGIVIAQHIPPGFSARFAQRLNNNCAIAVKEAADGDQVLPGHAYIAPGSHHLKLERSGARYICRLDDGEPVNRHKPSVDVLFRTVAEKAGKNALGILLTGMGDDGANGLLEIRNAGARTIAQDEKTSVVWGMPGEAVKRGGAVDVMGLHQIAPEILRHFS